MKSKEIMEQARRTLRVVGWTPSRFAKWKDCPQRVLLEDLIKMCPVCFLGRVSGGYDGNPVTCDTCVKDQPEREALDRGNRLDAALTANLSGVLPLPKGEEPGEQADRAAAAVVMAQQEALAEATRHPRVLELLSKFKRAKAQAQVSIVLARGWKQVGQFTKGAWGRLKLDVLLLRAKVAEIYDWKSGNIDRAKGSIRERAEYADSMLAYQIAVLSTHPQAEARATMVFIDAPPKLVDPTKTLIPLKRKDLAQAQRDWERKIEPMMSDTHFAPRPGVGCGWCPFSQRVGGPCQF